MRYLDRRPLAAILMLVLVTFVGGVPASFAQTPTSVSFNKATYFQGDSGSISVTIRNDHSYQICTKETYLQFDWQQAQKTAFVDSSDTSCIGSGNSFTFTISFSVPADESVGQHSYTFHWVDQGFLLGDQQVISSSLQIHDAEELVYDNTFPSVQSSITQYQSMNFRSPAAQSQLSQAINYYNQATTLANQGQWSQAVADLNQASSNASQAYSTEQAYEAAQAAQSASQASQSASQASVSSQSTAQAAASAQNNLVYGVIVVLVVIVVAVALILNRRKPKSGNV